MTAQPDSRLAEFVHEAILDDLAPRCLPAALAGGTTWQQFKAKAERQLGLPWPQIRDLLDERSASRKATT